MGGRGGGKVQKVMVQPINLIFRYLQNKSRIQVWLYENVNHRIEGQIVGSRSHSVSVSRWRRKEGIAGFDEYMNVVLDEAEEIHVKTNNRRKIGRILLKGDNITLIQAANL